MCPAQLEPWAPQGPPGYQGPPAPVNARRPSCPRSRARPIVVPLLAALVLWISCSGEASAVETIDIPDGRRGNLPAVYYRPESPSARGMLLLTPAHASAEAQTLARAASAAGWHVLVPQARGATEVAAAAAALRQRSGEGAILVLGAFRYAVSLAAEAAMGLRPRPAGLVLLSPEVDPDLPSAALLLQEIELPELSLPALVVAGRGGTSHPPPAQDLFLRHRSRAELWEIETSRQGDAMLAETPALAPSIVAWLDRTLKRAAAPVSPGLE